MKFNIHIFLTFAAYAGAVSAVGTQVAEDHLTLERHWLTVYIDNAASILESLSETDPSDASAASSLQRRGKFFS